MSISSSQSSEETLQQAIMLLQQTEGKFNSFEEVVEEARKWSIYFINPYERAEDKFFQQRPTKDVFEFVAEDKLTISLSKFKAIKEYSRRFEKGG